METFGFDRFNTFHYSNEETTSAFTMDQIPQETINERAEILGEIADRSTIASLEKMVGKTISIVIDGESTEHEYLLSARPLSWAVEIDGEVLINDTSDLPIIYGKRYQAKITQLAGEQLLATLISDS
jgi:tRNA A37 methylthiotransferase MiaB